MTDSMFSPKVMSKRKAIFMDSIETIKIEGYEYLGRTKKGHVFQEISTEAFVEISAVAKKEDFDFGDAENEYLEAVEARKVKAKEAEAKKLAKLAKKEEK